MEADQGCTTPGHPEYRIPAPLLPPLPEVDAFLAELEATKESESGCSYFGADSDEMSKEIEDDNSRHKAKSDSLSDDGVDLDNPKPTKSQRPTNDPSYLSCQYSERSFCGIADYLPDGFYDAGRDRPFMPLGNYEQNLHMNLRKVVLLDRQVVSPHCY
ncbi:leucine-rich repeat protein kinase family protein [Striga asiatica]|uniref:Leucine-rich repeat protein kinase family protein n=1 Tax=Striga asiatica TaxID=4170 RepID=A0A5A7PQ58_STRAF|nr:leucine-rich repeat protein kinase family protein [Striga asiatica]